MQITIKQLNPNFDPITDESKDPEVEEEMRYLWGLAFEPDFKGARVDFHANVTYEFNGFKLKKMDVLEVKGKKEDEKILFAFSKSLIADYDNDNKSHDFFLKGDKKLVRLSETCFANYDELPEELKKKLKETEGR